MLEETAIEKEPQEGKTLLEETAPKKDLQEDKVIPNNLGIALAPGTAP